MNLKLRTCWTFELTEIINLDQLNISLTNYLFAKANAGKFVVKIADTHFTNEAGKESVITDMLKLLKLFNISPDEGALELGKFGPYSQTLRSKFYLQALTLLEQSNKIYKCFCTGTLDYAQNNPDFCRCFGISPDKILQKTKFGLPFAWKFHINHLQTLHATDLLAGDLKVYAKNLTDFKITNYEGTFTKIFMHCIDIWQMQISHVIRTDADTMDLGYELALFDALCVVPPIFCHIKTLAPDEQALANYSAQKILSSNTKTESLYNFLVARIPSKLVSEDNLRQLVPNFTQIKTQNNPPCLKN